jgi:hypothetical protein
MYRSTLQPRVGFPRTNSCAQNCPLYLRNFLRMPHWPQVRMWGVERSFQEGYLFFTLKQQVRGVLSHPKHSRYTLTIWCQLGSIYGEGSLTKRTDWRLSPTVLPWLRRWCSYHNGITVRQHAVPVLGVVALGVLALCILALCILALSVPYLCLEGYIS